MAAKGAGWSCTTDGDAASHPSAAAATSPMSETPATATNQPTTTVPRLIERVTSQPARPRTRSLASAPAAIAAPTMTAAASPTESRVIAVDPGAGMSATRAPTPTYAASRASSRKLIHSSRTASQADDAGLAHAGLGARSGGSAASAARIAASASMPRCESERPAASRRRHRRDELDPPAPQVDDVGREAHLAGGIAAREQDRLSAAADPKEAMPLSRIEGPQRLVEQQDLGVADEGGRQGGALLHRDARAAHRACQVTEGDARPRDGTLRTPRALVGRQVEQVTGQAKDLGRRHPRVQPGVRPDVRDPTAPPIHSRLRRSRNADPAALGSGESGEDAKERRRARVRVRDEQETTPNRHRERTTIEIGAAAQVGTHDRGRPQEAQGRRAPQRVRSRAGQSAPMLARRVDASARRPYHKRFYI